jgi:hypothetical protein
MGSASKARSMKGCLAFAGIAFIVPAAILQSVPARAQAVDCARLQQQIAASGAGGGNRVGAAIARQRSELGRTAAYARQLGCDRQQFLFFGGSTNPQCGGLNARIQQMQANLGQLQEAAGGGGGRADLVARFNAYCRGGQPAQQPRQRGFFESIFGGGEEPRPAVPADAPPSDATETEDGEGQGSGVHGGSQAVCVRTCDGGFFPMSLSSHHSEESLSEMCKALCPGTDVAVYSRNPDAEIRTAVGLDGKPYMDLPNALKFQKSFDAACTCRPAGKTWAEALANAESVLGNQRKGDIIVTPEKSVELSRPKLDSKTKASILRNTDTASASAAAGRNDAVSDPTAMPTSPSTPATEDSAATPAPDGTTRHVRRVGPQL